MSAALAIVDARLPSASLVIPTQASSDKEMVALWLASFRSSHTRRAYAGDARAFLAFAQVPLHVVTVRLIQSYASSLEGRSAPTIGRRLTGVKSLIAMAHRLGYLPFDVGAPVALPVVKDTLAERILTEFDVQRMLEAVSRPRDAALLRLIYVAGLRISEACGLLWRDLVARDAGMGQITVFGKGGKTRHVVLKAGIWSRLLGLRGNLSPDHPVFRSRNGGGLCTSQVHRILKQACARVGLPVAVSTHWLRHAHVSHALDRGAPVHVVQQTVGHASLETTTRYTHVRPGDSSSNYIDA